MGFQFQIKMEGGYRGHRYYKKQKEDRRPQDYQKSKLKTERRYGWFKCKNCYKLWESSYCTAKQGTDIILYRQECKKCETPNFPYKTEPIQCPNCKEAKKECICKCEQCGKFSLDCRCKKERNID